MRRRSTPITHGVWMCEFQAVRRILTVSADAHFRVADSHFGGFHLGSQPFWFKQLCIASLSNLVQLSQAVVQFSQAVVQPGFVVVLVSLCLPSAWMRLTVHQC